MSSRRRFLQNVLAGAGIFASAKVLSAQEMQMSGDVPGMNMKGKKGSVQDHGSPVLVETPDVTNLPFRMDGNVKEFHLVAEPVKQEIVPGRIVDLWGYNGSAPGPTIQVTRGDRVRIIVDNHLPEATSMHWHGFEIPVEMDGAPGSSQEPIPPGGRFVYEFTLSQEGTYFYHSHMAMQEMIGMIGAFVMHPKETYKPRVDKDFVIILQEYAILPNITVPNSMNMEFNWLTFNGKSGPANTPLIVRQGERVRIRLINLGMDHHPIHLHGHQFVVTGTEGGRAPESTWYPMNTVLVGVAQARVVEFEAKYPGAWMIHCHLPHHMMNSMMDLLSDRQIQTADQTEEKAVGQMMSLAKSVPFEHVHPSPIAANAEKVPGFPQDAFMEMAMDEVVERPETYGLPKNWSAGMMGMMTMVRVLPEKEYDAILARKKVLGGQTEHQHES